MIRRKWKNRKPSKYERNENQWKKNRRKWRNIVKEENSNLMMSKNRRKEKMIMKKMSWKANEENEEISIEINNIQ